MRGSRDYNAAGPIFVYLILSHLFFGRGPVGHLWNRYVAIGTNPGLFIFFLDWWKHLFVHHVKPFFTIFDGRQAAPRPIVVCGGRALMRSGSIMLGRICHKLAGDKAQRRLYSSHAASRSCAALL
jgi:hypothetical protein